MIKYMTLTVLICAGFVLAATKESAYNESRESYYTCINDGLAVDECRAGVFGLTEK